MDLQVDKTGILRIDTPTSLVTIDSGLYPAMLSKGPSPAAPLLLLLLVVALVIFLAMSLKHKYKCEETTVAQEGYLPVSTFTIISGDGARKK